MANQFLTNDVITFEALDVLENTDAALININSEYSDQFQFGGAVLGQTLSIRKPPRYIGRLGQAAQIEAITETFVPLTLSYQRGVDTQVSSQNLTLDIDNYRTRVVKPQIVRLSNLIDQDVCNLAQGLNNSVGTPGTTPTTLTTYGLAKVKLDNMAAPDDDGRCAFLNPIADFTLMDNLKGLFHNGKEIASQYDSGSMTKSSTLGMDWYMDQNIFVQTVGTLGGTPTTNGVPTSGASTVVTQAWSSTTLNAGDVISFISTSTPVNGVNPQSFQSTGQPMQFVVTATTTDSAGAMTIPIAPAIVGPGSNQQNVTNLPASGTAIFVYDTPAASFASISGKQTPLNLVVHKDFGTIAMVDLPLPGGTDKAYRAASRKSGKSLRVIRDYVATTDQWIQRLDVLYGTAVLRQELGCRVSG
jgi:P22 coat protein - gene protein 5